MENTRKGNFREKWELLKSVWRGLLTGQTKYFVELVHSHNPFIDESKVTAKRCFLGLWVPGMLFLPLFMCFFVRLGQLPSSAGRCR